MENLVRVHDLDDLKNATAHTEHYWLLKHSSTCPVSASAWNEYNEYCSLHPNQLFLYLVVQEDRELSKNIESLTEVKHASPQAFHFANQSVDWNASHGRITSKAMQEFIA
jgi:bacillithiol system protein YtxJ